MAKLDQRTRCHILASLCEGVSVRSCERIFRVEQNTVAKLLADAGDMAISLMQRTKGLVIETIQADELYSFVGAKQANVDRMSVPVEGAGTVWTYLAVCAKTKLIFNYHLGDRSTPHAEAFMRSTAEKLSRSEDGGFVVRPTIVTDGLAAYQEAISTVFGADANHGVYMKRYTTTGKDGRKLLRKQFAGVDRISRVGEIAPEDIHTAYVERQNLNVRMKNRRFNRRTNAFSKRLLNHERHLALLLVYSNYCLLPVSKRQTDEEGKPLLGEDGKPLPRIKRLTPAMEAGITDFVWEVEDLVEMADAFTSQRRLQQRRAKKEAKEKLKALFSKPKEDAPVRAPFWVYESTLHHTTKVHATSCKNCNDGRGKGGKGDTKSGRWLACEDLAGAKALAEGLQPDRNSICNMCLGSYRTRGYRDPR
jgi:IS1 family transposase